MANTNPRLVALTPLARKAANRERIEVDCFPFRIGRESRVGVSGGHFTSLERRRLRHPPNNEIYLRDSSKRLQISREHLQIEKSADGVYELVDRRSVCGTIVDDEVVGGEGRGGRRAIVDGSVIVIGTVDSPYRFRFILG